MKKIIILGLVVLGLAIISVGAFFIFKKPTPPAPKPPVELVGKCGDNICDVFEKANPNACPADCAPEKSIESSSSQKSAENQETSSMTANVTVDYSKNLGVFNPYLFGIQGLRLSASDPSVQTSGFKLIATHAPTFAPLSANGYESKALATMDKDIKEILKLKATPMLYFYQIANPIRSGGDTERYSSSVQAIAKHLRDTWPGQKFVFFFGNEPDWEVMTCAGKTAISNIFWDGSRQDFFKAYAVWAKAIKSVDANFIVGGVGVAIPTIPLLSDNAPQKAKDCKMDSNFSGTRGEVSRWITDFLDYAKFNKIPVDFFSFHEYSTLTRLKFYDEAGKLAEKLKRYENLSPLFGAPLLATNEWNMMLTDDVGIKNLCFKDNQWNDSCVKQLESFKTAYKSAHSVVALINMIDQGLQINTIYTALYQNVPAKSTEETKSDIDGSCRFFTLVCANENRNIYYALKGFNWLAGTERLAVSGGDHANFAAIAGKTDKNIIIVLANYDYNGYNNNYPPEERAKLSQATEYSEYKKNYGELKVYNKYSLTLNNLPWSSSGKVTYERYVVDDNKNLELTETKTMPGDSTLTFTKNISAPSVEVVKVYVK
jgi:hypothetical protein